MVCVLICPKVDIWRFTDKWNIYATYIGDKKEQFVGLVEGDYLLYSRDIGEYEFSVDDLDREYKITADYENCTFTFEWRSGSCLFSFPDAVNQLNHAGDGIAIRRRGAVGSGLYYCFRVILYFGTIGTVKQGSAL